MKKIYLRPYIEFEDIEDELLYQASVQSEDTTPETGGTSGGTQGPGGGEEIGDDPEGGFDW